MKLLFESDAPTLLVIIAMLLVLMGYLGIFETFMTKILGNLSENSPRSFPYFNQILCKINMKRLFYQKFADIGSLLTTLYICLPQFYNIGWTNLVLRQTKIMGW